MAMANSSMRAMRPFLFFALLACVTSYAQTSHWPAQDGNYVIKDFQFGSGESIPELKLHYLTLGKPHRNAAGHTDNVVLLLHGTGGDAHSLSKPSLFRRAVRARPTARHYEVLHHPSRRHRPR